MTALGSLHHSNMLELLSNPTKSTQLQIELAITVDVVNAFVNSTYNLEGDGPLVFYCQHLNIYPFFPLLQLQCIIPTLLLFAREKN